MKINRRRVTILVVVALLAGLVGGGVWYFARARGELHLKSADLAMKAGNFEKAERLARKYITEAPDEWQGYFSLGQALAGQGRYEKAREELMRAWDLAPGETGIAFAVAETHVRSAQMTLRDKGGPEYNRQLEQAMLQLRQADEFLGEIQVADSGKKLDLLEQQGRIRMYLGEVTWRYGERLRKGSELARINPMRKADWPAKGSLSRKALDKANEEFLDAIRMLLSVIQADPTRGETGVHLLRMCRDRGDDQSYELAKKAIMEWEHPAPDAAMAVLLDELGTYADQADAQVRHRQLRQTADALDRLRKQNPEHVPLKVARARVGLMLKEIDIVEALAREIIAMDPGNLQGRSLLAQVQGLRGDPVAAERGLARLATDHRNVVQVQYEYAQAALAAGKTGLARQAMGRVLRLNPEHGPALVYFAQLSLDKGLNEEAYKDSRRGYALRPGDPMALRVYLEACHRTGRDNQAAEELDRIRSGALTSAPLMVVAADGYALMGQEDRAKELARKAVALRPKSARARYAVARALVLLGRLGEAENAFRRELAQQGADPMFHKGLGQLYERAGRVQEASEQYALAVQQGGGDTESLLALARTLLNSGEAAECKRVLDQVDAENPTGRVLRLQASVILGEKIDTEELIQQVQTGQRSGLRVALVHFASGQPERCVTVCRSELRQNPGAVEVRLLLGQALLALGRRDECIKEWTGALRSQPDRLGTYLALTRVMLAGGMPRDLVGKRLGEIPDARKGLVAMARARMEADARQFDRAADILEAMLASPTLPAHLRGQGGVLRAYYLARGGKLTLALAQLEALGKDPVWAKPALLRQGRLLASAGRMTGADEKLLVLRARAEKDRDALSLRRVLDVYLWMYRNDRATVEAPGATKPVPRRDRWLARAKAVCQQHDRLQPDQAESYLLWTRVWAVAGNYAEQVRYFRKAIERQPGRLQTYRTLAGVLESAGEPGEALAVLDQMEPVSQTGRVSALWERGRLLQRWGLKAPAAREFAALATEGMQDSPRVEMRLARALADVGERVKAMEMLAAVAPKRRHYLAAQLMRIGLMGSNQKKMDALVALDEKDPGNDDILTASMEVLGAMGEWAKAGKAFGDFVAKQGRVPVRAGQLALQAQLRKGDLRSAANLCIHMYDVSKAVQWHRMGVLLSLRDRGGVVDRMLPKPSQSDVKYTLLGLAHTLGGGDSAKIGPWAAQLRRLAGGDQGLFNPAVGPNQFLVDLATGGAKPNAGQIRLACLGGAMSEEAVGELAAQPASPARTAEAAKLLQISLALQFGLKQVSRAWALELIAQRPGSLWAEELYLRSGPDKDDLEKLAKILGDSQTRMARRIRAEMLLARAELVRSPEEFAAAAKAFAEAASVAPVDPSLLVQQAQALVAAWGGQQAKRQYAQEALATYRQAMKYGQNPLVANNAANLVCRLYPADPQRRKEALQWSRAAVHSAPKVAAYRDALGWLAYLQGDYETARRELRRAVRGLPDSIVAHYHLGRAEAAAGGDSRWARWHLEAALGITKARAEAGGTLSPEEQEVLGPAREQIKNLPAAA